ncbi:hypothetical protein E2I00_011756, partial [Balaenoptera physalus]
TCLLLLPLPAGLNGSLHLFPPPLFGRNGLFHCPSSLRPALRGTLARLVGKAPDALIAPFSGGSMLGLPGLRLPPAGPVIVVHGLFDSSYSFRHLLEYINETHPGTVVTVLDLFDGRESLRPLWEQVQGFREAVAPIMAKAPQGMGQYGDTDYLKWLFPTSMRSNLYRICYSPWGQEFSICNYWHDPHHDDLYLNASSFLALINGERDHPNATAWRKNFLRVGRLVLIGGPDDGVITPWQSSFFGFYDANETVLEMEEQLVYLRDSFGLKTLLARGAIVRCPVAGISHTAWHSNRTLYETCIEPWLS